MYERSKMGLFKFIPLLLLFITQSIDGSGQILIGPVAGGHVSWSTFEDKDNKDLYKLGSRFGYHAGASIAFRVQKRFFLQGSFLYTQKSKILDSKIGDATSNHAKFKYIDVPILYTMEFKAKLKGNREFKWYLGAGPNISYWLSGKGVLNHGDLNENLINPPNYDLPYKITFRKNQDDIELGEMNIENPNRIQLGLNFSAGVIFEPIGFQKIMITTRFELGNSFLSKDSKGDFGLPNTLYYEDDLRVRNMGFYLSTHYFIDLKIDDRKRGKSTVKDKRIKK